MWKKDNPGVSSGGTGPDKRDTSSLMGVKPQIPGSPRYPASTQEYSQNLQPPQAGTPRPASPLAGAAAAGAASGAPEAGGGVPGGLPPAWNDPGRGDWQRLFSFHGKGWDYFKLMLVNFLLSLATLGVYSFWGRTKIRAYLWGSTRLLGEPLEYTGTGKELFISFLIVMPIMLIFFFVFAFLAQQHLLAGQITLYLLLIYALEFAIYRALRYRLTRTRWRGIRGNLTGSAAMFALKAMGYILLLFLSLGLASPWVNSRLTHLILNNVWFGDRPLAFQGSCKELYKSFLLMFAGIIGLLALVAGINLFLVYNILPSLEMQPGGAPPAPLIGLLVFEYVLLIVGFVLLTSFYHASFIRWMFRHLAYGKMRTRSTLTGKQVLTMRLTNTILLLVTLGWGYALTVIRNMRLHFHSVEYAGDLELESLLQDDKYAPARGEGLLDALDVDMGF